MVLELFDHESAKAILSVPIPIRSQPDKLIWTPNSEGVFTIKSAYRVESEITSITPPTGIPCKKKKKKTLEGQSTRKIEDVLMEIG